MDSIAFELNLPVLHLSRDFKVVGFNQAASEVIPRLGMESPDFDSLFHAEDRSSLSGSNYPFQGSLQSRLLTGDGSGWRWVELMFGQLEGEQLCLIRDIHSEVDKAGRDRQEKADAYARLEQAQLARNRFLDIMSHELRTPLTAILGLSEALDLGLYGDCTEDQREAVRTINDCGASLLRLINDILDVTKLETDKIQLQLEPLHAADLCKSLLALNSKFAREKGVGLAVDLEAAQFRFVGDRKRLKQALSHLIDNAIKFTERGGHVVLEAVQCGEDVLFSVLDQGPGIASEELPTLLTSFQQSDQRLSRHYGGAGLGLRLAKKLVDLMNGRLEVENREDGGACFRIALFKAFIQEEEQSNVVGVRGDGTILVIDDHTATAKLLRDALSTWGFEVKVFSEIASFKSDQTDASRIRAVLMDGKLPDGSGIDCIRWMREQPNYKDLPIVFLTASEGLEVKRAAMAAGASAHLEKPVKLVEIAHCLDYLLG